MLIGKFTTTIKHSNIVYFLPLLYILKANDRLLSAYFFKITTIFKCGLAVKIFWKASVSVAKLLQTTKTQ